MRTSLETIVLLNKFVETYDPEHRDSGNDLDVVEKAKNVEIWTPLITQEINEVLQIKLDGE